MITKKHNRQGRQFKRARRSVDGIILLDKPVGLSSNAALQKVRWFINAQKAGHTGSLDPLATGVLPLCFGEATKLSQFLLDSDKAYETWIQLGVKTTTGDTEGEVIEECSVDITKEQLCNALAQFKGSIEQIPPMYSALKHEGQPLYKLARAGETVARKARTVIIHHIELLEIKGTQAHLYVSCSKGTYIRTLAEDIGSFLGCNAHLASLRRVKAGPFDLSHTVTLTQLEKLYEDKGSEFLDQFLQPIDSGLNDWPLLTFSSESAFYWLRGQAVSVPDTPSFGMVRVRDINNRFLGIGQVSADKRILPKRLIRTV